MEKNGFAATVRFDPAQSVDRLGRPLHIRAFAPGDAPALSELYRGSVRALGSRFYTEEQLSEWANLAPSVDQLVARYARERTGLVATSEARPVVFGDLDAHGQIGYLYSHPDWARSGAAEQLYLCLEGIARTAGIGRLHVEASELARRFFARRGFRWVERQEFALGSVRIHNHRMEKLL